MQLIKKYFPQLNDIQLNKLLHFEKLIKEWNKISGCESFVCGMYALNVVELLRLIIEK